MLPNRLFPVLDVDREEKTRLSRVNRTIDCLFEEGKREDAHSLKIESIKRVTFLYGPWVCNFSCPDYCYTKGTSNGILTVNQTIDIIEQAKEMGALVTYWPGEGELTLVRTFWDIMDYQAKSSLPAVLFSNGSIFHDDKISNGILDECSDDLIDKLNKEYHGLYVYIKYWHSDPSKAAEMVGVDEKNYPYETINGKSVPLALVKLLDKVPRDRLGVEIVVSRENYREVIGHLLPTAQELDIYAYVEPVIFSGNASGKQKELTLTPEQHYNLRGIFASGGNYCEKRQSTELIVKGTLLTPGIAVPPRREDSILDNSGNVLEVFSVFHNDYFRRMREISDKSGGCLCRRYQEDSSQFDKLRSS